MAGFDYDLAVIGAGPGGYVAAIRAAQLGLRTACIERDTLLGGTCLTVGCIPSKALLDSSELYARVTRDARSMGVRVGEVALDLDTMLRRKDAIVAASSKGIASLFAKHNIDTLRGAARFVSPTELAIASPDGTRTVTTERVIVATGSAPVPFPGVAFDEERIVSSTGALSLGRVPEHLIVIGGGVIGMELGSVWLRLGSRITILELMPTILPGMDDEAVKIAAREFERQGFTIRTAVRVAGIARDGERVRVSLEGGEALEGDHVLVAMGRRPYTDGLGAGEIGIRIGPKGAIEVDARYHTGVGQVYAVGDAIGGPLLAHKAEEEGIAAAENAAGQHGHVTYQAIPAIVYTAPEIASVGLTEQQARNGNRAVLVGRFPFRALGRARAMGETAGFVKVIGDATTHRLLGVHIVGPRASDLIAEAALAMEYQASVEDLALSVHAHPTLPEAIKEAALGALGRHINL